MKILITGIAGLIGSHLHKYLHREGHNIIGIDDFSGGYYENLDFSSIQTFYNFNLLDQQFLYKVFEAHKPDVVFHLAAYAAEGLSPFIRKYNYENNLICSVNIINACIKYKVKKLIFTSSMSVYGIGEPPFNEGQRCSPIDSYGIAKYSVEQDIKVAHDQHGLNYVIVRPHNIIGCNQNIWDKYRNVIGIWIRRALHNEPLLIYGDGLQRRAFSDIKYYLKPFLQLALIDESFTVNLGADKDYQLIDIANYICEYAKTNGYHTWIEHKEQRHEVKYAYCDHTKAKTILEFKDETNIYTTINEMFHWAKAWIEQLKQQNKYEQISKMRIMNYEITDKIYEYWK